jgi:C_GCAxxG_C_C family probable redox protein
MRVLGDFVAQFSFSLIDDEGIMSTVEERASKHFNSGYNCAESVVKAVAEEIGTSVENPQSLATGFGGGFARRGEVCGCLSGAALAIGLLAGRTESDDTAGKDRVYAAVNRLFQKFELKAGGVYCRDITGLNFDEQTHHEVCCPLVEFAARVACEEIRSLRQQGK